MKKKIKNGIPSLREAFVVREKFDCDGDDDADDKGMKKEALPPPIPGTAGNMTPPPIPSTAMAKPAQGQSSRGGIDVFIKGIDSDLMGLEKDLSINRGQYQGLDTKKEMEDLKKGVIALKTKIDNWKEQQQSRGMGNA